MFRLVVREQTPATAGTDWQRAPTSTSHWSLWALSFQLLVNKGTLTILGLGNWVFIVLYSCCTVLQFFFSYSFCILCKPLNIYIFLPLQPRTPRCQVAVRVSTVWPLRVMAACWEATAALCLEEVEAGKGSASFPTEIQSWLGFWKTAWVATPRPSWLQVSAPSYRSQPFLKECKTRTKIKEISVWQIIFCCNNASLQ